MFGPYCTCTCVRACVCVCSLHSFCSPIAPFCLRAADQHDFMQSLKDSSTKAFDGSPLITGSTYFHSSPSSIQTYHQYDSPSPFHASPHSYQDTPSSLQSSPQYYQDSPSSLHASPRHCQDTPSSLQNSPQYYQDSPSSNQSNPQYNPGSHQSSSPYQQDSPSSQYHQESPQHYSSNTDSHLSSFQHSPQSFSSDEWVETVTPFNPSLPAGGTQPSPAWHQGSCDLPAAYSSLSISNGQVSAFPATSYSASLHLKVEPTDYTMFGDLSCQAPLTSGGTLPSWEAMNSQRMPVFSGPATVKQQMADGGCLFNSTHLIHNMH